jgi:hypothetical protein
MFPRQQPVAPWKAVTVGRFAPWRRTRNRLGPQEQTAKASVGSKEYDNNWCWTRRKLLDDGIEHDRIGLSYQSRAGLLIKTVMGITHQRRRSAERLSLARSEATYRNQNTVIEESSQEKLQDRRKGIENPTWLRADFD